MKAIIPFVALAIQVATAQSPDSVAVPAVAAIQTVSVDTVPAPAAIPAPVVAAPVVASPMAAAPVVVPAPPAAASTAPRAGIVETYGDWQLGFAAGPATGYGFSMRKWFGEKDAIQLNLAPYVSRTNYPEEDQNVPEGHPQDEGFVLDANVSVGLTWLHEVYQYRLDPIRELKLLSYLAGSGYFSIEQQQMDRWRFAPGDDKIPTEKYYDDYRREEKEFTVGGGAAAEFSVWRFSAILGFGLGGWYEAVSENFGMTGDAQIGTHFRF
jgi:hypothetical protein